MALPSSSRDIQISASAVFGLVFALLTGFGAELGHAKLTPGAPPTPGTPLPPGADSIRVSEGGRLIRPADGGEIRRGGSDDSVRASTGHDGNRRTARARDRHELPEGEALVRFGEDILIAADEEIESDVVAIGGDVEVFGTVLGDVVAVGGEVFVRPGGSVDGDVVSIGGEISQEPGSRVRGSDIDLHVLPAWTSQLWRPGLAHLPFRTAAAVFSLVALWLVAVVVDFLWGSRTDGLTSVVRDRFWSSLLIGVAVLVLLPAALLLLVVTLIGIPLALLLPPLVSVALVIGLVIVARLIGHHLLRSPGETRAQRLTAALTGLALFVAIPFAGALVRIGGGPAAAFGAALEFFGFTVGCLAAAAGFGALLRTRLGWRVPESHGYSGAGPRTPLPRASAPRTGELL